MNKSLFLIFLGLTLSMSSCNRKSPKGENYTFGDAKIISDESLFPVVDDEHLVFQTKYKRANIEMVYKPLKEALSLFLNDSIDVAVLPRQLQEHEKAVFDKKKITVRSIKFAIDGIAIITSKDNPVDKVTIEEIKAYLNGTSSSSQVVVFDNAQSSTVEYLMRNFNVNELNSKNLYALKTSEEVIKYVRDNPKAFGIISVSWIRRPTKELENVVDKVKCLAVKNDKGVFVEPTQSSLKTGDYPLIRDLYLIDCQGKAGLGTGFAAFLASDIGQRIILKSGIAPDSLPSRQIIIRK